MTEQNIKDEYDNDLTQKSSTQTCAATPQNEEKTEDEVENEMMEALRCDGTCERIMATSDLSELECGHSYCGKCMKSIDKAKHTISVCPMKIKECKLPFADKSSSDMACHEGSLSKASRHNDNAENDSKIAKSTRNMSENKSEKSRRQKSKPHKSSSWYSFLHKNKPLAISMPNEATYGELLNRVALCLEIDLVTNEIDFQIQQSSSESSREHALEVTSIGPVEPKTKLTDLKLPKSKMIIIDIRKKRSKKRPYSSFKDDSIDPSRSETSLKE